MQLLWLWLLLVLRQRRRRWGGQILGRTNERSSRMREGKGKGGGGGEGGGNGIIFAEQIVLCINIYKHTDTKDRFYGQSFPSPPLSLIERGLLTLIRLSQSVGGGGRT